MNLPHTNASADNGRLLESPRPLKRSEPRFRTRLCGGRIYSRQQYPVCYCVIRDHSAKGARLLLPPDISVSGLIWFCEDGSGEAVWAEVRWQRGREIGIRKLSNRAVIKTEAKDHARLSGQQRPARF